jgi:hypothetical protein
VCEVGLLQLLCASQEEGKHLMMLCWSNNEVNLMMTANSEDGCASEGKKQSAPWSVVLL